MAKTIDSPPSGITDSTLMGSHVIPIGIYQTPVTHGDLKAITSHMNSKFNKLLSALGSRSLPTTMTVTASGIPRACHVRSDFPSSWMLDSGANNHMTGPEYEKDF